MPSARAAAWPSVPEERILDWMRQAVRAEGIAICPEAAACVGAVEMLRQREWIAAGERVVIFNTGAAQKYLEAMQTVLPRIDRRQPLDWKTIAGA